jgi:hypothetical protein
MNHFYVVSHFLIINCSILEINAKSISLWNHCQNIFKKEYVHSSFDEMQKYKIKCKHWLQKSTFSRLQMSNQNSCELEHDWTICANWLNSRILVFVSFCVKW